MSILIFGVFFAFLWLLIEIMSILLKMTGLDLRKARFQLISILTHTGFTTRESELIVQHPSRRRIASILMVISYASQFTLISLLFDALYNNQQSMLEIFVAIIVILIIFIVVSKNQYLISKFDRFTEKALSKQVSKSSAHKIEKILNLSSDFSIYELVIDAKSPLCNKVLKDLRLKDNYIQILKIDRGTNVIDFPTAQTIILQGDRIVVYGKISEITKLILD